MIPISIDEFSLDWIRDDQKQKLSAEHPGGDAFQKICGNILADPVFHESSGTRLSLVPFPTLGKDGAIDHFGFTEKNETVIVECKKNKTPENALTGIEKLKKGLRNLDSKNAPNTIYKPWFNRNLKQYIFCTSCIPSSAAEYEKIKEALKDMMQEIGSLKEQLAHLKSIEITVYCWPQLKEIIERSAFLMYKWVKPGIEGVEYVSKQGFIAEGYRAYLSSDKIPYISRDSFIRTHPAASDLPSERKYLDELIDNPEKNYKGIIIYGEGGIGKTRLMRELALKSKKKGWHSYKINPLVDFRELLLFLRPGGKYLLLFDYIEELPEFHEWVEALTQIERAYEVKIIANCRSSYISNVRIATSSLFIRLDISNSSESSRAYYMNVVGQIIKNIPALKNINNRIFRYRPSFAVFVRYMYDRDGHYEFDLKDDEDFGSWIIRRLELSFSTPGNIKPGIEILTKLFACLPARGKGKEFLEDNYTAEIGTLIKDGWFETRSELTNREQKQLAVIHDTLADEVLIDYVEQNGQIAEVAVRKFFDFAAKNDLIYGCCRAFERVVDHPLLSGIDFGIVFSRVIDNYPVEMARFYYHLVKTSLIPEEKKITLYFKHKDFFSTFITSPDFSGPLSYVLNDFSKKQIEEKLREQVTRLYQWWYDRNRENILTNQHASKIISTAIKFFGNEHIDQELIQDYLRSFSLKSEASFVIGAWLESGGDKEVIEPHLLNWLQEHATDLEAQFVYNAWLKSGGDKELVNPYVFNWLQEHAAALEARFVIGMWLESGGEKERIKLHLLNWLKEYDKTMEVSFLIPAWLECGGDKETVELHLSNWLQEHSIDLGASFMIGRWLESGGDKEIVKLHLSKWLKENDKTVEASFLIPAWLECGGDKETVELHLSNWLQEHSMDLGASFMIGRWLESGGDKEIVKPHLSRWLKEYDKTVEASFLIPAWLECSGDKEIVKLHLSNWLEEHSTDLGVSFMIGRWLEHGGDKEIVKLHFSNWLGEHSTDLGSSFMIRGWLESGGDREIVESHLSNWLKEHASSFEAKFVIGAWLGAGGNKEIVKVYFSDWLKEHAASFEASFMIGSWLESGGEKEIVKEAIINWLQVNAAHINASHIFQPWLKSGGNPEIIEKGMVVWLKKNELKLNSFYTIGLWLKKGGTLKTVRPYVAEYIDKFNSDRKADFLLDTWMQSDGEVPIIEE